MTASLKTSLIAVSLLSITPLVAATDAAPVRAGLWEVTVSGPSISERIKNTPVEKRRSMEQVAGISIQGETMVRRVCITSDMLAQGISTKNRPDCEFKQTWKGKVTKITFQCPNGNQGKGELTYPNKESYKGWIDSEKSVPQAGKKTIRVLQSGKWMAKDCAAKNN
jgi:hypothetical protein